MIKIVFFDFDGVLTTDKGDAETTCKYVSEKLSLDLEKTCDLFKKTPNISDFYSGAISEGEFWRAYYETLKSKRMLSISYDAFDAIRSVAFGTVPLDEKMFDIVKKIKQYNNVGVITDNCVERMKLIDAKYNLSDLFSGGIFISADLNIGATKANRKIFDYSLDKAGSKSAEAVFIDNKRSNLVVPKKMGFKTIYFDDAKRNYDDSLTKLTEFGVRM